jgi:hypothetical protein
MSDAPRWLVVFAIVLIVVGLIAFARGQEHHRGDDIGALGSRLSAAQIAVT